MRIGTQKNANVTNSARPRANLMRCAAARVIKKTFRTMQLTTITSRRLWVVQVWTCAAVSGMESL